MRLAETRGGQAVEKAAEKSGKNRRVENVLGKTSVAVFLAEVRYGATNGLFPFLAPMQVQAVHTETPRVIPCPTAAIHAP